MCKQDDEDDDLFKGMTPKEREEFEENAVVCVQALILVGGVLTGVSAIMIIVRLVAWIASLFTS